MSKRDLPPDLEADLARTRTLGAGPEGGRGRPVSGVPGFSLPRSILDSLGAGYFRLDAEGRFREVNRAWLDLHGFDSAEEVLGRHFGLTQVPADLDRARQVVDRLLAGESVESGEFSRRRKDGSTAWHTFTAQPVLEGGRVTGLEGLLIDSSEAHFLRQRLHDSQAAFRAAFDHALQGMALLAPSGHFLQANRALCRMLGYSEQELHTRTFRDLSHPEDLKQGVQAFLDQLEGDCELALQEKRYLNRQGGVVWARLCTTPVRDDRGRVLFLVAQFEDVTTRKVAEEALRLSEERLRLLFANLTSGFALHEILLDEDGRPRDYRFLDVNPAFERLTGLKRAKLIGRTVLEVLPGTEVHWIETYGRVALTGEPAFFEHYSGELARWYQVLAYRPGPGTFAVLFTDITDRRLAEEARARSEERLKLAMAATRDGLWDWNVATGEVYYSPGYARMLGYEPAEVEGNLDFWSAHLHPEDRAVAVQVNEDCIENRRDSFEAEFRMRAKDGTWRWILGRGDAVARDASGRALRLVGTHADVTDRRRAEEALRESEERFRQLFENAPVAYQSLNEGGFFLDVNRKWRETLGYTAEEVRGTWFGACLVPRHRALFEERFSQFKAACAVDGAEFDMIRKDGTVVTVSFTGRVQTDGQGRFLRTHCVFTDITERKRAEEALRGSEERARNLAEQLPVSIMRFDRRGRVTFVNDWHLKNFARGRVDRGYFLGRRIDELPGIASAGISERLLKVLEGRTVVLDEVFVPRFTGGHAGWVSLRAVPELRDGKMAGGILLREDITARRKVQDELRRAKEAAEAADRGKGEFLANMSHEIRTPLNGVLGMLHLLQGTRLDEEQALYADTALESGRHLLDVINDILDLTRLQAGRLVFRSEPFDLAGLLNMVVQSFTASSREKGLTLTAFTDPAIPSPLLGDASRIRQVLFNLVGNSLKFTERGQVRVEAWLLDKERGGVRLFLSVADTGIGIPENRLTDIFESFTQVDGSLSRRYQGTGLGLAIVRRMVEGMGGAVSVDSAPDQGTTVAFSLRLARSGEACPVPEPSPQARVLSRPLRILVAEDDRINRLLTSRVLQKMGHESVCVESGAELLEAWRREPFDCILMDIQMPGMNGMEATRAIREAERARGLPRTPVVALTAYSMAGDRERFLAADMDGYLPKPLEQTDLERLLATLPARPGSED